jgi:hypothetical protein
VVGVATIVLAVAAPVAGAGWTRADRRLPQPHVWDLAAWTAPYLSDNSRVAMLLPGDNRSVALMLRVAIAISPPYRTLADFEEIAHDDTASLVKARKDGNDFALISCVSKPLADSPEGQALKLHAGQPALLAADGDGWRMIATEPFLAETAPETWTTELSPGPFCR